MEELMRLEPVVALAREEPLGRSSRIKESTEKIKASHGQQPVEAVLVNKPTHSVGIDEVDRWNNA